MQAIVTSTEEASAQASAFAVELACLESRVGEISRQLDRLETDLLRVLSELAEERFEEYR